MINPRYAQDMIEFDAVYCVFVALLKGIKTKVTNDFSRLYVEKHLIPRLYTYMSFILIIYLRFRFC